MRLFIAEKPSLGRAIAEALPGAARRGQGHIRCGEQDVVSWCVGHLLEPAEPHHYNPDWKLWRLHTLPMVPPRWDLQPRQQSADQLGVLKGLIEKADEIVHAGDPDREGQLLVDEVLDWFQVRKPVQRLLINDLTPSAVRQSLARLDSNQRFKRLSDSAQARQRADWLYGLNLTRAYTLLQQQQGQEGVFSVGRVQTPVLGLVVERDRAIEQFEPHPFYVLNATLTPSGQSPATFTARWLPGEEWQQKLDEEGRLLDQAAAEAVAEKVQGKSGQVLQARFRERPESPPLPLSLSILQIQAARLYNLSAQNVLEAAQSLYEKYQLITYPRSDCRYLPEEQFDLRHGVIQAVHRNHPDLAGKHPGQDHNRRSRAWNSKQVDAHHGIIPTDRQRSIRELTRTEAAVYDLVARFYLMQFEDDARFREGTLVCDLAGERFRARETGLLEPGWKHQEPKRRRKSEPAPAAPLPRLQEGEGIDCLNTDIQSRQTQPPTAFTDATLLSAMTGIARFVKDPALRKTLRETDGLGTEATRAHILQTLFRREFLTRENRFIHATDKGRRLIDALPESVTRPDRTAVWEARLETVKQGQEPAGGFLKDLEQELRDLLAENLPGSQPHRATPGVHCPRCRAPMREREGRFGAFYSCTRYPECKGTRPIEDSGQHEDGKDQPPIPCPSCHAPLQRRQGKHGWFWGCSQFPACRTTLPDLDGRPDIKPL